MDTLVTTNEMITFLAVAAILGLFAAVLRQFRQVAVGAMTTQGVPRFTSVLRRLAIDLDGVDDERTLRAAAVGVRNCLVCRHQEACDGWLADRGSKGAPPGCPNEQFLREHSRV